MFQRILVPLDGSQRAEAILPYVEELARRLDALLILFTVIQVRGAPWSGAPAGPAADAAATWEEPQMLAVQAESAEDAQLTGYLDTLQKRLRERGLRVDQHIHYGGPVPQAIMDRAEQENADLIALTSHGRTGLARVFYGSVAAAILNRSDRPLLIVRSPGH